MVVALVSDAQVHMELSSRAWVLAEHQWPGDPGHWLVHSSGCSGVCNAVSC